ncbi:MULTISPECIES: extracellular solute-binding protein [unclassified Pseudofrankia]|uniref:extracellular solute-binding protein n=1 Tax=unclassified Pseudofrankia TaxID=2994372 RepID=UPI0008DAE060|nr:MULTISPECIES: extracellular solute-binding protein [unclassified Pseudofrankia]MDT3438194.1 extracellular solute-binding protein [Pseudofrankia sp. BMG5.37]OHV46693.1 ABC transporter substrate-binding protein [Pseudofrankia sp. BMG5.36]
MKKKLTGRVAGGVALVAATTLALTACGGGGSSGDGSTTLKLVVADYGTGPDNASSKYWQGIADAFHAEHADITVKITSIPWTQFDQQVQTMIQNKQYPDITEGDYFSNYAEDGLLYTASDVLSNPGNLLPAFKDQGTFEGQQYGLPFTTSSRTLFYNKKLFTQAGITSAPKTWADVQADAEKVKGLGQTGFGLPLGAEEAQAESLLWMLGAGGGYQADGKYTIDSAANVEAFTFLKGLVAAGDTEPNPGTVNRTDLWQKFAQGQVGMINGSPALIPIIQEAGVLQDSDWTSVPIAGKSGPLATTLGVCDNVAAFKPNGHQTQIKQFLDFAYQDKYQLQFDKEYKLLPATSTATAALASDPVFAPFLTALPKSIQYPSDTSWANLKTKIQQTIGTAVTGDPASVLGDLQKSATAGS